MTSKGVVSLLPRPACPKTPWFCFYPPSGRCLPVFSWLPSPIHLALPSQSLPPYLPLGHWEIRKERGLWVACGPRPGMAGTIGRPWGQAGKVRSFSRQWLCHPQSFFFQVSRSCGLRTMSFPSPGSVCSEAPNGQEARRFTGSYEETIEPQHSKHDQLLTTPSWSVCLLVHLVHPGTCPKSSSFPPARSLESFLPLIMEPHVLEATRILLRVSIAMALFSQHSGQWQLGPLKKWMVSKSSQLSLSWTAAPHCPGPMVYPVRSHMVPDPLESEDRGWQLSDH